MFTQHTEDVNLRVKLTSKHEAGTLFYNRLCMSSILLHYTT